MQSIMDQKRYEITENEAFFGPLYEYVMDDDITDVDFNGSRIWLTDTSNLRYPSSLTLSPDFVEQFSMRVANTVSKPFHKQRPVLEAQTDRLRITIVHESVAISGRSICIRKSLPYMRMSEESMVAGGYCSSEVLELLKGCVASGANIVFCGEPGAGKTECARFFSQFIPAGDRVITIEDTPEWHYHSINPDKDCVELQVSEQMDYTTAIRTSLRLNPKWMMLSESRSTEVVKLIESFSTGVKGITTLHTDDVRKVPDRMVNMSGQRRDEGRMENDIYSFVDIAVLITRRENLGEDGSRSIMRFIDQIAYFERADNENICHMILDEGRFMGSTLPDTLAQKLARAGVPDPLMTTRFMGEVSQRPLYLRTEERRPEEFEMISFEGAAHGTFRGIV